MAEKDEILVKYKFDISQADQSLDNISDKLKETEVVGKKTFDDVGASAKKAGTDIDKLAQKAVSAVPKFNSLNNSINQLSRELPAFAVSANTGLLAISNNIPALADAIGQINAKNKELASQGKETTSVIKQLGAALFSWQSLLSIGVTLLTVYGGKILDIITGTSKLEQAQKNLAKSTELSNKAFEVELKRLKALGVAEDVIIAKKKEHVKVNIMAAEMELSKQEEILTKTLDTYKKAQAALEGTFLGELAQAFAPSDEEVKDLENKIEEIKIKRAGLYVDLRQLIKDETDYEKKESEKRIKTAEKEQKEKERLAKQEQALMNKEFEDMINAEGAVLDAEEDNRKRDEKERKDALKEFEDYIDDWTKTDKAGLAERLKNQKLSFGEQYDLLVEQLNKGYITEEGFAQATQELNQKRVESYIMGVQAIANTLVGFAQLAGQNTEAGKALASAGAIIDSIAAAQLIFRAVSTATYLGPAALPLATVSAAGALAQGFARVQQINAVTIPQSTLTQPNFISAAATYKSAPQRGQASMGGPSLSARRFKDGVVDLDGPGTWTSDSIPAYLSKGESVIPSYQTSKKKDDLTALWKSVPDYERFIQVQYVQPALKKQAQSFAENVSMSAGYNFNDKNIVKAINKNKPATAKDILLLTNEVAKQNRAQSFERKLKGNGR